MSDLRFSIVADAEDLDDLMRAAASVAGVKVSPPHQLDTSGEGLNFPIDAKMASDLLEITAATISSVQSAKELFKAWLRLRRKRGHSEGPSNKQVLIAELRTGRIFYEGPNLDATTVAQILAAAADGSSG